MTGRGKEQFFLLLSSVLATTELVYFPNKRIEISTRQLGALQFYFVLTSKQLKDPVQIPGFSFPFPFC